MDINDSFFRIQIENLNQVIRRLQDNRLPIEGGGNDGGWGAAFQRLLNFGHNRDNDGRNQAPHAAIAENLDNLALNPNQDIPPPAPDHGIPPAAPDHEIPPAAPVFEPDFVLPSHDNGGLRRRHPVPYPQNPPYPSNQNVVRPIPPPFIANSGGVAKVPELPTKQRTHSAEANLGIRFVFVFFFGFTQWSTQRSASRYLKTCNEMPGTKSLQWCDCLLTQKWRSVDSCVVEIPMLFFNLFAVYCTVAEDFRFAA